MFQSLGGKVPCERMRTSPDKQLHRNQEGNLARHAEISDLTTSLNITKNLTISEKLNTRIKGKKCSQFSRLARALATLLANVLLTYCNQELSF